MTFDSGTEIVVDVSINDKKHKSELSQQQQQEHIIVVDVDIHDKKHKSELSQQQEQHIVTPPTFVNGTVIINADPSAVVIKPSRCNKRVKIPDSKRQVLKTWLLEHLSDPYPSRAEKESLAIQSGLAFKQVSDFMGNWRKRELPKILGCTLDEWYQ
jgi:hypothetical protein